MSDNRKVIVTCAVTGSGFTPTMSASLKGLDQVGW